VLLLNPAFCRTSGEGAAGRGEIGDIRWPSPQPYRRKFRRACKDKAADESMVYASKTNAPAGGQAALPMAMGRPRKKTTRQESLLTNVLGPAFQKQKTLNKSISFDRTSVDLETVCAAVPDASAGVPAPASLDEPAAAAVAANCILAPAEENFAPEEAFPEVWVRLE